MNARGALFDRLESATRAGVFPGCVALVWKDDSIVYHEGHGELATHLAAPMAGRYVDRDSHYDLASLTKILCTTTISCIAVATGRVSLDDHPPEELAAACPGATLRDLLEHASGLAAHREYFTPLHERFEISTDRATRWAAMLELIRDTPAACERRERAIYSDLGFMLLGAWLERLYARPLERIARALVVEPLGLMGGRGEPDLLGFRPVDDPPPMPAAGLAPTEVYEDVEPEPSHFAVRPEAAYGTVHDDNCFVLGGVAGHAGLFGTAQAVMEVGRAWLDASLPGMDIDTRDRFWQRSSVAGSTRCLGFDSATEGGSTGEALADAVGHLGFTGTSLWIDRATRSIYVLLSNRVHPTRENPLIREFRREFHQFAARL